MVLVSSIENLGPIWNHYLVQVVGAKLYTCKFLWTKTLLIIVVSANEQFLSG
jgi:hypothetical protein